MKEVGVSGATNNKNISLEDELNNLTNFGMDEKQILSSLNESVNQSSKIKNTKNINLDDIDNIDANDDDLNDPELLVNIIIIYIT